MTAPASRSALTGRILFLLAVALPMCLPAVSHAAGLSRSHSVIAADDVTASRVRPNWLQQDRQVLRLA